MVTYLEKLPKDVIGIIYSFLYDEIPKNLYKYVDFTYASQKTRIQRPNNILHGIFDALDKPRLLKSTKCKIHNYGRQIKDNEKLVWNRRSSGGGVCDPLILCQEEEGFWNKFFKFKHRFSIINGKVYHLVESQSQDNWGMNIDGIRRNTFKLVPYFESNHCWQDLAMRFLRNSTAPLQSHTNEEILEIGRKQREIGKRNREHRDPSGCIIC
jgi:hypothetical protein